MQSIPFIITISYLFSLIGIRLLVIIAGSAKNEYADAIKYGDMFEPVNIYIGRNIILFGHHIHHFYFGILLIAIAGWLSMMESKRIHRKKIAVLYGFGLGLFMDEIGLLLTWGNYYSSLTYFLSIFLGILFLNIVFFPSFWREVKKNVFKKEYHTPLFNSLVDHTHFVQRMDKVTNTMSKTEKISLIFISLIYIGVGILILIQPRYTYYLIASVFFLHGVTNLARVISRPSSRVESE